MARLRSGRQEARAPRRVHHRGASAGIRAETKSVSRATRRIAHAQSSVFVTRRGPSRGAHARRIHNDDDAACFDGAAKRILNRIPGFFDCDAPRQGASFQRIYPPLFSFRRIREMPNMSIARIPGEIQSRNPEGARPQPYWGPEPFPVEAAAALGSTPFRTSSMS